MGSGRKNVLTTYVLATYVSRLPPSAKKFVNMKNHSMNKLRGLDRRAATRWCQGKGRLRAAMLSPLDDDAWTAGGTEPWGARNWAKVFRCHLQLDQKDARCDHLLALARGYTLRTPTGSGSAPILLAPSRSARATSEASVTPSRSAAATSVPVPPGSTQSSRKPR